MWAPKNIYIYTLLKWLDLVFVKGGWKVDGSNKNNLNKSELQTFSTVILAQAAHFS